MNKKQKKPSELSRYDKTTQQIWSALMRAHLKPLARLYLWQPSLFNFMIVGASGTILSWILYEIIFRPLLLNVLAGTFFGMVITTFLVFLWNYFWNKQWSLSFRSHIQKMNNQKLKEAHKLIHERLRIKNE